MAETTYTRAREYKDISLSFQRNPITRDIITVTGEDAVKRSVKNLLNTMAGEVPFFPEFGTRLHRLLFEPIDPMVTALLDAEIRATLEAYEPRIGIQTLNVVPVEDESRYRIELVFQLLNLPEPLTLTLFLKRLR